MRSSVMRSQTRSRKQSSSHRCLLRSELTRNCRHSHEPQISSISCQACPRSEQRPPVQARQDMVRRRWKLAMSRARVRARARTRRKGKQKARAKEREKKNARARSSRSGVTTAENGGHKAAKCWHEKEKQVHQVQGTAGTASLSSSQSTLSAADAGPKKTLG